MKKGQIAPSQANSRADNEKTPVALAGATGVSGEKATSREAHFTSITLHMEEFRSFIQATYGISLIGEFIVDGEFHGIRSTEDRHGSKPFRYCVHLDEPQNVFFQDFKRGYSAGWFPNKQERLTPEEWKRLRQESETRKAQREKEIRERHAKAAERARLLWRQAEPARPDHPYLLRKKVGVHGIRYLPVWTRRVYDDAGAFETIQVEGVLLIPMRDDGGTLWNVQAIFPEAHPALARDKDFVSGSRKKALFHHIGNRTDTVCLAEGYATAASIHEATGYRTLVCFDAGNLPDIAQTVRGLLPLARIVLCADHDLPDKNGRRAGLDMAYKAAALVDGYVSFPPIEGCDFNDFRAMLREREGGNHG